MDTDFSKKSNSPMVIMSFDFEMRWGVHDIYGINFDGYRKNLENCRAVVISTLKLLTARNLRATWATVGALGLDNWDDYFSCAPPVPSYIDSRFAVRKEYADMDPDGIFHFAPDLIRKIVMTEGQDLGSHSFSHLYFGERGVTVEDFLLDMSAIERLWAERYDVIPVSLVFPRNQSAFLEKIDQTCIKIWRGNEPAWYYDCTTIRNNTFYPRLRRLIDSINPLTNRVSRPINKMVRASMFIRYSLPESLWKLQLIKLQRELNSLEPNDVSHLWWHPHNIGFDIKKGIVRLTQVLDIVAESCEKNHHISINMKDCLEKCF